MGRGASQSTGSVTARSENDLSLLRISSGKNRSALRWAARAHENQKRKGPGAEDPYLLHPMAVSSLLAGAGADRDLVCAGCLHDVVEDTEVTLDQIREEFGNNVAELVGAVTKDKNVPLEQQPDAVIKKCKPLGDDAFALKSADLLVNMTDLVLDAEEVGVQHWEDVFGGAKRAARKINSYLQLADLLTANMKSYPRLSLALQERAGELRALAADFGWLTITPPGS